MRFLLLSLLLVFAAPGWAQPGPFVVILLPGTSLRDWQAADAPYLHRLMASGALAVMNTRTARLSGDKIRETPESALLTLGAGSRAAGSQNASVFLASATAGSLYARRMGLPAPTGVSVNIGWPSILRANSRAGYDIHLGNLSDALSVVTVPVRAGGGKFADLLATSGHGTVIPLTSLDSATAGFVVWDAGNNVHAADALIRLAANQISTQHGRLIVLSPFASDGDYAAGRRLTPVMEYGEGIPSGLLASRSTRRPGLVTNTDFAPSIAAYFGRNREDFPMLPFGYAWSAFASPNAGQQVRGLEEQAYRQARGMQILPYFAVVITVWILLGTALACGGKLYGLCSWLPIAALLSILFAGSLLEAGAWFIAIAFTGLFLALRGGEKTVIAALATGIVIVLTRDMATGSHLMRRTVLGYSAVEGARYYGIGNEAMGLLIGSAIVLATRLWPLGKSYRILTLIVLSTIACLLGSPAAGAKAGGLLVSVIAFGTFVWESYGYQWSWRVIAALAAGTVITMGAVALGDALLFPAQHSHIGEAIQRINGGGFPEAWDIITRKLAVESHLAWHSAWACLLWGGLGSLCWLASMPIRINPAMKNAGMVAVAACLLFNDAGVVAAALCLVPLWSEVSLRAPTKQPWNLIASRAAS